MRKKEEVIKKINNKNKKNVKEANIDENKKLNKWMFPALLLVILIILASFYLKNINNNKNNNKDALKFKEEYEKLNGTKNSNGKEHSTLDISKNNPFVYSTFDEVFKILENGTGVIYFGFPECPWCRTLVPVLTKAADEAGIDKIYYLNCLEDRDKKEIKDKKIITTKEGSENYFKLVDKLKDVLGPYEGVDENAKRLYFPTVIFVKDGKIVDSHIATLDSQKDPRTPLTENQFSELKSILIKKLDKTIICNKVGC